MNRSRKALPSLLVAAVALLVPVSAALARDTNGRAVVLRFSPQESTHATIPDIPPALLHGPVDLQLIDDRQGVDKDVIGEAVDDDATKPIRTTSDVGVFARQVLLDNAAAWGIKASPGAARVLTVRLNRFFVTQNLKAVGAMYGSEVRTLWSFSERGKVLWEGTTTGSTHRYGKRNDDNLNEVLSDAIKEAYADGVSEGGLARAVSGQAQGTPGTPIGGSMGKSNSVTPAQMLADLIELKKQGFATDVLVDYVNQRTLSSELTAADLGRWKQAGMPPEVIKAALARSPGAGK